MRIENIQISILLPIYGVSKYIERCAYSLFKNDAAGVEYIFVNDCTKDDSIEKLKRIICKYQHLQNRVHIVNHKCNLGLAAARLTGLKAAVGKYVWFVDSDDYICPNSIECLLSALEKSPDMIAFNYYQLDANESLILYNRKKMGVNSILSYITPAMVWSNVIKRSLFFQNEIFPIQGINHSEDYILMARIISCVKSIKIITDGLYVYNTANLMSYTNNVSQKSLCDLIEGLFIVYKFYADQQMIKQYRKALFSTFIYRLKDVREIENRKDIYNQFEYILHHLSPIGASLFLFIEKKCPAWIAFLLTKLYRKLAVTNSSTDIKYF